jgi:hypothetical protein
MGQAALQYDEFDDIEPIEVPAGGIATLMTMIYPKRVLRRSSVLRIN